MSIEFLTGKYPGFSVLRAAFFSQSLLCTFLSRGLCIYHQQKRGRIIQSDTGLYQRQIYCSHLDTYFIEGLISRWTSGTTSLLAFSKIYPTAFTSLVVLRTMRERGRHIGGKKTTRVTTFSPLLSNLFQSWKQCGHTVMWNVGLGRLSRSILSAVRFLELQKCTL